MKATSLVIVCIAVGAAAVGGYRYQSSCVLGITGTRATLTLHGLGAAFRGKQYAEKNHDYYVRREAVTEPVLCEGEKDGLHYTVRDEGLLALVGRVLCTDLKRDTTNRF